MLGNYLQSLIRKYGVLFVADNDIIGRCKVFSVHSEFKAYKISELWSLGTDFSEVFESVMQQKLGIYYEYNVFASYLFERILANYDRNFGAS